VNPYKVPREAPPLSCLATMMEDMRSGTEMMKNIRPGTEITTEDMRPGTDDGYEVRN
jgi:hypothetical protein